MSFKRRVREFLHIDVNGKLFRFYVAARYKIDSIPYYIFRIFPIKRDKIVFVSFSGRYGGEPKYLSDELSKKNSSLDLVWLLKNQTDCGESNVRSVSYGSWRAVYELVTAKVWVDDCHKHGNVRKRNGQFYINTGHGNMPMKKVEKDAEDKLNASYFMLAKRDSHMMDLSISNSRWQTEFLKRNRWFDTEILECGIPSIEHRIKDHKEIREKIRKYYGIDSRTKIFMYAPTFRNIEDMSIYNLDFSRVGEALGERFGGTWIGFRRLHPNVADQSRVNVRDIVIDTSDYPDMEDLMMSIDLLITDYSSCIFETLFLDIPALIFATDIQSYTQKERGLYWDIFKLPFLIATDNEELVSKIRQYDPAAYEDGIKELKDEIGFFKDQTHATEKLVNRICEEIKK